jgi:hypothetical protein
MVDKATQAASTDDNAAVHIAHAAIIQVQRKLIAAIAATGSGPNDRYADLRSRCWSPAAYQLVIRIREEIEELERKTGTRTRKRRAKSAAKFSEATERFMGDLLRARAGGVATSRIFRATGKDSFANDPVKYDMFWRVVDGLKALGFVGHRKGQTRYRKTGFAPDHAVTLPGRAARFWATTRLVQLAEAHGITANNVGDHFALEPPANPLVLKDYATGRGSNRESGPIIKDYKRTPETERLGIRGGFV